MENDRLREILCTLHYDFITLFETMNERLPTNDDELHYWADPSRKLIRTIEIALGLYNTLKYDKLSFDIDKYYFNLITKCQMFLKPNGGSPLPAHMEKVELHYKLPIFIPNTTITTDNPQTTMAFSLKPIGEGSYANVFKYKDTFYNRNFVIKRAKKDLSEKELERFKLEYEEMKEFSSPYILEVFRYDEAKNEYYMECMDYTLESFIQKNNTTMKVNERKNIVNQILRAFEYIHLKDRLHRDISPKNILLKEYHDTLVVKVSDFGLVKIPDSSLTSANTEYKGYFNDPALLTEGFNTYEILHETFALTRIVYYVMSGKTNTNGIPNSKLSAFVTKGLSADKSVRFKSATEMAKEFRSM